MLDSLFAHALASTEWSAVPCGGRRPLLLLVSQHGHRLNDLLFRCTSGQLASDIPAIVSNHATYEGLCRANGIAFHHLTWPAGSDAAKRGCKSSRSGP